MDADKNGVAGLVEKIIKDLNHVLCNNELTEFDIVPLESTRNKSPVLYVQTSLGLESWCVKYVYNYCYTELIRDYLTNPKRRLSRLSNLNFKRIYHLLNPTILINPDVTTLWNKRREMLDKEYLQWMSELHFAKLVLSRKPKCNEAYSYRRFILSNIFDTVEDIHSEQFIADIISQELNVCSHAADKCRNNYHAWEHRMWLLDTSWINKHRFNSTLLFFNEYKFIKQWTSNHVSDYSCFHYRQYCVRVLYGVDERFMPIFEKMIKVNLREHFQKVVAENIPSDHPVTPHKITKKNISDDDLVALLLGYTPGKCKCYASWNKTLRKFELLFYELVLNEDLLKYYSNHETIWYHRRFLMNELIVTMYEYLEIENDTLGSVRPATMEPKLVKRKNSCGKCADADLSEHHKRVKNQRLNWFFYCPLFKSLMNFEKALIKDRRKDDQFCEPYERYIRFFEGTAVNSGKLPVPKPCKTVSVSVQVNNLL